MVLTGTPSELRRLLRNRIEELGTSFFCCIFLNRAAMQLFAKEVMLEFASSNPESLRRAQFQIERDLTRNPGG